MPSHQLSNGLYVSGLPEQYKERQPSFTTTAMPYTGGDVKKSGELGKMFDIPVVEPPKLLRKSTPPAHQHHQQHRASGHGGGGGGGGYSNSGPLTSSGAPKLHSASGPLTSAGLPRQSSAQQNRSGPLTSSGRPASHSGPLSRSADSAANGNISNHRPPGSGSNSQKNSGALSRQNSGSLIPATGLITSGPITSGPLSSSAAPHPPKKPFSGPLDASGNPIKPAHHAINILSHHPPRSARISLPIVIPWVVVPLFIMGFIAGVFILVTVRNAILLIVVAALFSVIAMLMAWNLCLSGKSSDHQVLDAYDDADLRHAKDGDYVKVTGVVTCGSVPLESSYQRMNRCIYTSIGLYEYRGFHSKPARAGHRRFTWALRYLERNVVDFYISDFQSGLRALVKSGYGAPVIPLVHDSLVVEVNGSNQDLPAEFLRWMGSKNLSCDDRLMHLKEGYVKEGSTVTVFGVVHRHENVLMIVPPREPISTGCLWNKLWFPRTVDSLIISCEDVYRNDGIPL